MNLYALWSKMDSWLSAGNNVDVTLLRLLQDFREVREKEDFKAH